MIGSRLEPLVDRFLIEETRGAVRLELGTPVERELVFVHDRPWEGNRSGLTTIIRDGAVCRMYYCGSQLDLHDGGHRIPHNYTCYAQTDDGLACTRPDLGLVALPGGEMRHSSLLTPAGSLTVSAASLTPHGRSAFCRPLARTRRIECHVRSDCRLSLRPTVPVAHPSFPDPAQIPFASSPLPHGRHRCCAHSGRDHRALVRDRVHPPSSFFTGFPGNAPSQAGRPWPKKPIATNSFHPWGTSDTRNVYPIETAISSLDVPVTPTGLPYLCLSRPNPGPSYHPPAFELTSPFVIPCRMRVSLLAEDRFTTP